MRKKSGFSILEQANVGQQKPPETWIERLERLTGFNHCLCPVCKTGRMLAIRELPQIRSPGCL